MTIFAEKLATLVDIVRLGTDGPIDALISDLGDSADRPGVAIGFGGSAIMAEFFARCRSTLGHGYTVVLTPIEFVTNQMDLGDHDAWLFSAGADNPDAVAAMTAAVGSSARKVTLISVNAAGTVSRAAQNDDRCRAIVIPVVERKDGFLATHSLVAMAACLLAASDRIASRSASTDTIERLAQEVERIAAFPTDVDLRSGDTVVVLNDPQCATLEGVMYFPLADA